MPSFEQYRDEYLQLWGTVEVLPARRKEMEAAADRITAGRRHYEAISGATGIPWYFIGFLHLRESSCNFGRHLHNGDPLSGKTRQVPANRPPWKPRNGRAYTFEESAEDALTMMGFKAVNDWSINRMLWEAERFNGLGYRNRSASQRSPYLWGGTNHQRKGKYVRDGVYDPSYWDTQPGVAAVLKVMLDRDPNLMAGDPIEEEAVAAPRTGPIAETHPEAHALLKAESGSYSFVGSLLKALGLPVALVGGGATAGAETGLQAYAPFISFFKEYGLRLALGIVCLIVVAEVVQVIRRQKKLS